MQAPQIVPHAAAAHQQQMWIIGASAHLLLRITVLLLILLPRLLARAGLLCHCELHLQITRVAVAFVERNAAESGTTVCAAGAAQWCAQW